MLSSLGSPLPTLSSNFLRLSLLSSLRTDGREFTSYRHPFFTFRRALNLASCEVQLGRTIAIAEALCSVSPPAPDRPLDGLLTIAVEISAAAFGDAPNAARLQQNSSSSSRNDPRAIAITRILERQLRDARAVDTETLCIEPGKKVWKVSVIVTILNASGGNLIDCCALAVAGALLHARRADVSLRDDESQLMDSDGDNIDEVNDDTLSVTERDKDTTMTGITKTTTSSPSLMSNNATYRALQGSVKIHSYASRAPLPLAMLHIPVCVSFALFSPSLLQAALTSSSSTTSTQQPVNSPSSSSLASKTVTSEIAIVDPSLSESLDCDGDLTFCVNSHRELCGMHKAGGCPVDSSTLLECARIAVEEGARLVEMLKAQLALAESKLDHSYSASNNEEMFKNGKEANDAVNDNDNEDNGEDAAVNDKEEEEEEEDGEEEEDNDILRDSGLFIMPTKRKVVSKPKLSVVKSHRSVAAVLDNVLLHRRS